MSRVFAVPTVLRMVPNALLKEFFARVGLADLGLDWDALGERDVGPVVDALRALDPARSDPAEAALRTVFDLACGTGVAAILEAGDPDLAAALPPDAGPYHTAMWAWLRHPDVVARATLIHQVEHLTWWRKRTDLPADPPDPPPDPVARLQAAVSDLLVREQGRGRRCTVDVLARGPTTYYFAFPDDFAQTVTAHDGAGRLGPRTFRRTFDVVFAHEPGALELFAKVPPRLKGELEAAFAKAVLGADLGPWAPPAAYELNGLKTPAGPLATDADDRVTVSVRRLRLAFRTSRRRVTLEADPDGGPDDVYRMMAEVLNREAVPPAAVRVTLATFCFEFAPVDGRRAATLTFDVGPPNTCSLRNQRPERVEVVRKYLRRWGVDVAGVAASGVAPGRV